LMGVDAAGVLIADQNSEPGLCVATDEKARILELLQLETSEGPYLECYNTGLPVQEPDISRCEERWPLFTPAAREAGYAAVHALPMQLRRKVIGAVNVFSSTPGTVEYEKVSIAQSLTDVATIGLVHQRTFQQQERVVRQL